MTKTINTYTDSLQLTPSSKFEFGENFLKVSESATAQDLKDLLGNMRAAEQKVRENYRRSEANQNSLFFWLGDVLLFAEGKPFEFEVKNQAGRIYADSTIRNIKKICQHFAPTQRVALGFKFYQEALGEAKGSVELALEALRIAKEDVLSVKEMRLFIRQTLNPEESAEFAPDIEHFEDTPFLTAMESASKLKNYLKNLRAGQTHHLQRGFLMSEINEIHELAKDKLCSPIS